MTSIVFWSTFITYLYPQNVFRHFSLIENSKKLIAEDSNPRFSYLHVHKVVTAIALVMCHNAASVLGGALFYSEF